MKILTIDVGTGTQDIFLYDSRLDLENGLKMVLPSPTMMIQRKLQSATHRKKPVLLSGVLMGGGSSQWAAENHIRAGLRVYATPEAARSFNDDLDAVRAWGVTIVSQDEAARLRDEVIRLEMRDLDLPAIMGALARFGVELDRLAAVGVAVFDHGNAPKGYSDRQFRFDYLDQRIRQENRLSAFAYRSQNIPASMTRLQAVADSGSGVDAPLVVMDSAPAAVLGAAFDPWVASRRRLLVANVGNFHTLAFRLGAKGIEGVFEHHTGLIDLPKLEGLLKALADGSLRHKDVFDDHGHGALIYSSDPLLLENGDCGVVVSGPRRSMLWRSRLNPHFAAPFGDMMIAGCFGLLAAIADVMPDLAKPIRASLRGEGGRGTPPWELTG